MAADASVFTIALAAQMLGKTEDRLWALADQMDPEDGLVWIHDTDERQTMAFTSFGLETLRVLIADQHTTES
jgi:threonine dehydratase